MPGGGGHPIESLDTQVHRATGHETDSRLKMGILESLVLNDGIGETV